MANLTTTSDIKTAVLTHAGEKTDGTSPFDALVLTYINRVYQEIISGGNTFTPDLGEIWPWAKAQTPGVLILQPQYVTGSVTLTNGSASGVFSSPSATSVAGGLLRINNRPEHFRILTHVGGNANFTIDCPYSDASGAGLTFQVNFLEYAISGNIQRLVAPMRVYRAQTILEDLEGKIYGIDLTTLDKEFPLEFLRSGTPTRFAIIGEADGVFRIRVNTTVALQTKVEYDYIPVVADLTGVGSEVPIVPREDRIVLVSGATYWLMIDKEDSRADAYFRMTQSKLQGMMLARRREFMHTSKNIGKLLPRQDQIDNTLKRLRITTGLGF